MFVGGADETEPSNEVGRGGVLGQEDQIEERSFIPPSLRSGFGALSRCAPLDDGQKRAGAADEWRRSRIAGGGPNGA